MGRKPPLNLDIDEAALLSQIDGEDFVSKVRKKQQDKIEDKKSVVKQEIEKKDSVPNNTLSETFEDKSKIEATTIFVTDDKREKEYIQKFLISDVEIDYENRKRIDVDPQIHDRLKKIISLLNTIPSINDSTIFLKDYINRILFVHIEEWGDLSDQMYDKLKKSK